MAGLKHDPPSRRKSKSSGGFTGGIPCKLNHETDHMMEKSQRTNWGLLIQTLELAKNYTAMIYMNSKSLLSMIEKDF